MSPSPVSQVGRCTAHRHFLHQSESLAGWAIMRTALCNYYALDKRTTLHAWLPILLIDAHMVVVIAGLSPHITITAKGSSAMLDATGENDDNSFVQSCNFRHRQCVCSPQRVNGGIK